MVVEPPADESPSGDSAVLRPSEDSGPVGFIAGYVGLTAVGVALVFVGRRDATGQSAIPRGTDVAYGPRSATDFWAEPSGGRRQTESEDRNRPRGALR